MYHSKLERERERHGRARVNLECMIDTACNLDLIQGYASLSFSFKVSYRLGARKLILL